MKGCFAWLIHEAFILLYIHIFALGKREKEAKYDGERGKEKRENRSKRDFPMEIIS